MGGSGGDGARESAVAVRGLTKRFGDERAVDGLSFDVREGELLCLLGPSGCGKTTTLRLIAGLEEPDSGDVYIRGERVTEEPPHSRGTSVVFQEWALFGRKTVMENVCFAGRMEGVAEEERRERAREILRTVGLSGRLDAYPDELSGGQKQRVALARSLAADPEVLLLDEPLSNLDESLRKETRMELLDLHEEMGKTTVHVTHDQEEAFTLADRVGIMRDGSLVQIGEPSEVYAEPANRFVESFLTDSTFVTGTVDGTDVTTPVGRFALGGSASEAEEVASDKRVEVSVRPEDVTLSDTREGVAANGGGGIRGIVEDRIDHGAAVRYRVRVPSEEDGDGGLRVPAEYSAREDPRLSEGDEVEVSVDGEPSVFYGEGRRLC